ncbi:MAG: hypothetical protein R3B51_10860 [Thermodesulfobacteriota bacterium]
MFSGKKLIVVRNAEKLAAKETAALEGYFAAPRRLPASSSTTRAGRSPSCRRAT